MNRNIRNKPYHPLGKVKEAIKNGEYEINETALKNADDHFGWSTVDIEKALQGLKHKHFTSSKRHFTNPDLWVDHYRANGLMGENVYTHFHFDGAVLIIESLKRR
ncbi:type II toxin-antitoxin system MqsR family toxin [Desulfobacula sp.]|uniref:type II toxin-antitoxin system MqsR family toxin n=1 Tax=Desulfobacula sp. TaxID=2593537 RepID=UPI00260464D8|nr:type II toxin-antitoxin system MqsR family toxin [Desulfobacula sp.]